MSKEDLVPITTTEQAQRLGRIGGSVSSPAKKRAAQLRELRKRGLTDDGAKRLLMLLEDPNFASMDILEYINQLKTEDLSHKQAIELGHLMVAWFKMQHGDKQIRAQINIDAKRNFLTIHDIHRIMASCHDNPLQEDAQDADFEDMAEGKEENSEDEHEKD